MTAGPAHGAIAERAFARALLVFAVMAPLVLGLFALSPRARRLAAAAGGALRRRRIGGSELPAICGACDALVPPSESKPWGLDQTAAGYEAGVQRALEGARR